MLSRVPIVLICVLIVKSDLLDTKKQCPNEKTSISGLRKRRYLTFPDGFNVVISTAIFKVYMTHAPSGWNLVSEFEVLYPLPNANFTNSHFRRKLHHRQKKEIWERIRNTLDMYNYNGQACILRSICEAKKYLAPPGKSLIHDILRAIFLAPVHDEDFRTELGGHYRELFEPDACNNTEGCSFSFLDVVLALNKS